VSLTTENCRQVIIDRISYTYVTVQVGMYNYIFI